VAAKGAVSQGAAEEMLQLAPPVEAYGPVEPAALARRLSGLFAELDPDTEGEALAYIGGGVGPWAQADKATRERLGRLVLLAINDSGACSREEAMAVVEEVAQVLSLDIRPR